MRVKQINRNWEISGLCTAGFQVFFAREKHAGWIELPAFRKAKNRIFIQYYIRIYN
jgi:hypothetical protein